MVHTAWPDRFRKAFSKQVASCSEWLVTHKGQYITLSDESLKGQAYYELAVVEDEPQVVLLRFLAPHKNDGFPAPDAETRARYCGALTTFLMSCEIEELSLISIRPVRRKKAA